jgi:hypothetical protein
MSAQQSPATSPKNSSVQEKIELKPHEPALCIPRVFPNIKDRRIRAIFREAGLAEGDSGGEIDHIDFAKKTAPNGKEYNRVFIHFKTWPPGFEDLRIRLIQNAQQKNPLPKLLQNHLRRPLVLDHIRFHRQKTQLHHTP